MGRGMTHNAACGSVFNEGVMRLYRTIPGHLVAVAGDGEQMFDFELFIYVCNRHNLGMKIIRDLSAFDETHSPVVLTIGNFDGMHRGHQAVIARVKERSSPSAVLTFENHPTTVLRPARPAERLTSLPHRIQLIENQGIDTLILLKFTKEFSQQTAEEFLTLLKSKIPFTHLILGHDATIGKDRLGKPEQLQGLAKKLNFEIEYIPEYTLEGKLISSSMIRQAIREGNLKEASSMLGREFSMIASVIKGAGKGKAIGFPTANIDLEGFCIPPFGVYGVKVIHKGEVIKGIANIGVSPTVKPLSSPQLEVFLFNFDKNLYGEQIEVVLEEFIRPEIKFASIEALQVQIQKDIERRG